MELPQTMQAVVLIGHGGLEKMEYRTDYPTPVPEAGEVVVRVGACGLNNTDINTRTAWYSKTVTEGITDEGGKIGYESADSSSGSWGNSTIYSLPVQLLFLQAPCSVSCGLSSKVI